MRSKFSYEHAVIPVVFVILVILLALAYYNRRAQDELISALIVDKPENMQLTEKQADLLIDLSASKVVGLLDHVFSHAFPERVPSNQAIILASYYRVPNLYISIQNLKRHEMRENTYIQRCSEICVYDFAEAMYDSNSEQSCKKSADMASLLHLDSTPESIGRLIEPLNERFLVFLLQETESLMDFLKLNDIDEDLAKERAELFIIHQLGSIAKEKPTHQYLLQQLLVGYNEKHKNRVHFLENAIICLKERGALHP